MIKNPLTSLPYRVGYACLNLDVPGSFQTLRLSSFTEERWREKTRANLSYLKDIVTYHLTTKLPMLRLSSDLIPLATLCAPKTPWEEEFAEEFSSLRKAIAPIRFSMHPGQYTVLNSPNPDVVRKSIEDLDYHARVLKSLGGGPANKMVLHIGGRYGDAKAAMERFIETVNGLPESILQHLVLENDQSLYHIEEVLFLSRKTKLPVIFDNLHHRLNRPKNAASDREYITAAMNTWGRGDGRPIIHYSQEDPIKRKGAHSKTIELEPFLTYLQQMPATIPDLMLEVKDKNRSAEKLLMVLENNKRRAEVLWAKNKYEMLSKSHKDYLAVRALFKEDPPDILRWAHLLEHLGQLAPNACDAENAALHVWGYFKEKASPAEKKNWQKKQTDFKNGRLSEKTLRQFLVRLLRKYPNDYLQNSTYFDADNLNRGWVPPAIAP
ncbi:hypothetical protein ABB02_01521 [Clostridiaceae bacterium JG1575]|nr:hypothetical protein ABB02_01521 [Clostridiaceae bacterium JG1575]